MSESCKLCVRAKLNVLGEIDSEFPIEYTIEHESGDKAFYFPGQEIATFIIALLGGISAAVSAIINKHIESKKCNIKFKISVTGDLEVDCTGASKEDVYEILNKVAEFLCDQKVNIQSLSKHEDN